MGERIVAVLKQKNGSPVEVAHQVCILFAVIHGCLDKIPVAKVPDFETRLQEFMENRHPEILTAIRTTGKLEQDTQDALKSAIGELLAEF